MRTIHRFLWSHPVPVRIAWLVLLLVLAACNNPDGGGGGGAPPEY